MADEVGENNLSKPVRRSAVQRMLDSINDMNPEDREKLTMMLLDASLDEAPEVEKESEPCFLYVDYYKDIEEHDKMFGQMVGLGTGIKVIDDMTMGLAPGELTIIAAPTSTGKSMLCLNIADNIAMSGRNVGFITMEMTKPEIGARLKKIMGDRSEDMVNIIVNKSDRMSWKSVDLFVEKAVRDSEIRVLFIDHLHYFSRSMSNAAEELGIITQEFKHIAIKHNIPVVLVSHTRKTDNMGQEREATMNDLRGSSFIAQDADIVLMLNKVWEQTDMGRIVNDSMTKVRLEKNRNRYGVPVGTSFNLRRNGLRFERHLSAEETIAWNSNKPKPKEGFSQYVKPVSAPKEEPEQSQTDLFDQSDLI